MISASLWSNKPRRARYWRSFPALPANFDPGPPASPTAATATNQVCPVGPSLVRRAPALCTKTNWGASSRCWLSSAAHIAAQLSAATSSASHSGGSCSGGSWPSMEKRYSGIQANTHHPQIDPMFDLRHGYISWRPLTRSLAPIEGSRPRSKTGHDVDAPPTLIASTHSVDYTCAQCGTILLHAEEHQIHGLLIHCKKCGSYNATEA
jgi:DNA-directed RNA polymerase subunit RPC12/RpoP